MNIQKIEVQREHVIDDYRAAISKNKRLFINGNDDATSEYIYGNQMVDASNIVDKFILKLPFFFRFLLTHLISL